MEKKWMQGAVEHPGALHRALGAPEGENIPDAKVEKAAHSKNTHLRRMANLAKTFAHHRPGKRMAHHEGGKRAF